ncbi:unnamed protein product [Calypogeia fissa]
MRAAIWKRFVTKFEENALNNPRPVVGLEPLFITLLRHMMPSLGLKVWDSLAEDSNYSRVVGIVSEAKTSPQMGEWARKTSKDVVASVYNCLSQQELKTLTAVAYVTNAIFGEDTESRPAKAVKRVLPCTRESVVALALEWLSIQRANVTWEKENGWSVYETQAKAHYAAWKHQSRERSCATTMPNLVKAYKLFKGCSDVEAVVQVLADSERVDTSDEEDLDKEDMELHGEKGNKTPSTKSHCDDGSEFAADSEASEDEAQEIQAADPVSMATEENSREGPREDPHGRQADHDTYIIAVMGLFNLSQNLQQPHSMLGSQDVPDVFKNRTPFLDLLFAQTQPSPEPPKTQKQLAQINQGILREAEHFFEDDGEDEDDSTFLLSRKMIEHLGELGNQCAEAINKLDRILDDVENL